jgi:HlyD family secretion protein
VAEFTPKTVETEDLRTQLVYEVRVFVKDGEDRLRLGMPVTVIVEPAGNPAPEGEIPRNASSNAPSAPN